VHSSVPPSCFYIYRHTSLPIFGLLNNIIYSIKEILDEFLRVHNFGFHILLFSLLFPKLHLLCIESIVDDSFIVLFNYFKLYGCSKDKVEVY